MVVVTDGKVMTSWLGWALEIRTEVRRKLGKVRKLGRCWGSFLYVSQIEGRFCLGWWKKGAWLYAWKKCVSKKYCGNQGGSTWHLQAQGRALQMPVKWKSGDCLNKLRPGQWVATEWSSWQLGSNWQTSACCLWVGEDAVSVSTVGLCEEGLGRPESCKAFLWTGYDCPFSEDSMSRKHGGTGTAGHCAGALQACCGLYCSWAGCVSTHVRLHCFCS